MTYQMRRDKSLADISMSMVSYALLREPEIDLSRVDLQHVDEDSVTAAVYESIMDSEVVRGPREVNYCSSPFFTSEGPKEFTFFIEDRKAPFGIISKTYVPEITIPQYKNTEVSERIGDLFLEMVRPLGFFGEGLQLCFFEWEDGKGFGFLPFGAVEKRARPFLVYKRSQDAVYHTKKMIDAYVNNESALKAVYNTLDDAQLPLNRKNKKVGDVRWQEVVGQYVAEEDFFRYRAGIKRNPEKKKKRKKRR